MTSKNKMLFVIAFLEGASLMIAELLGAKIMVPFYGASLYVWSSVLDVTLVSLAIGYYFGGSVSQKYKNEPPLFYILLFAALFVVSMPHFAPSIMNATTNLVLRLGSFVSVLLFLSLPIICMGMVSPMIMGLINREPEQAGKSSGMVYAISTVGGVLGTFLAGFYFIPGIGIKFIFKNEIKMKNINF